MVRCTCGDWEMALGYAEGTERCRHNWDVGLKGVARLEGKGLQLGRLQRPCSETGCHCLKALGVPRAGPLENPSGHDMEKGWKGASMTLFHVPSAFGGLMFLVFLKYHSGIP